MFVGVGQGNTIFVGVKVFTAKSAKRRTGVTALTEVGEYMSLP